MGMVDITQKPVVKRKAVACGKIYLYPSTIQAVKSGEIKKGDPLLVAEVSAMNSAKQTHLLIPHCHQIPLDSVELKSVIKEDYIELFCTVKAQARTGVEMEALVGVTSALNTIWDMVKYLEKDPDGQYPDTRITDIRVIEKLKEMNQ